MVDDGSSDGTSEMVRADFPSARLERLDEPREVVACRNLGADLALAPVIVSIDDDARMPSPDTVSQTLQDFDDWRVGAVAIPWIDLPTAYKPAWRGHSPGQAERHRAPSPDGVWARHAYVGAAHAVRRDLFLGLGGYRSELVHSFEEPDFCLRLLDAGYVVRAGRADRIEHVAGARNVARWIGYSCRNPILLATWNVPARWIPGRLLKINYNCLIGASRLRWPHPFLRGLALGYRDGLRALRDRRPVHSASWRLWTALQRAGALRLEEIIDRLPPPRW